MRLKKGTKVEVLSRRGTPSGSWCTAKILSGNGHYYDVRYDQHLIVERVPKKFIRPCPPAMEGIECWLRGDIVEVFEDCSWKIAKVVEVMGGNDYVVRLLGSTKEFRVHESDLRVRQSWQDNEWILIGKDAGNWKPDRTRELSAKRSYQKSSCRMLLPDVTMKVCTGDGHSLAEKAIDFQEPIMPFVSARTKKRKSGPLFHSSHVETTAGARRKMRAIEKFGGPQQSFRGLSSPLLKKVDAVASPQKLLGENYMHASFKDRTTGFSKLDMESRNPDAQTRSFFARSIEPNDAESSDSSVASCSGTNYLPLNLPHHSRAYPSQNFESPFDNAESWECGRKCSSPTEEELATEIHNLELHAYRSTMEAFYASGPLSWEQEALMTNLRLNLHISNDEHLTELRHLASAQTELPIH